MHGLLECVEARAARVLVGLGLLHHHGLAGVLLHVLRGIGLDLSKDFLE